RRQRPGHRALDARGRPGHRWSPEQVRPAPFARVRHRVRLWDVQTVPVRLRPNAARPEGARRRRRGYARLRSRRDERSGRIERLGFGGPRWRGPGDEGVRTSRLTVVPPRRAPGGRGWVPLPPGRVAAAATPARPG